QIILGTLCAFLMKTRKVWIFSTHMLPLLARLCAAPNSTLLTVNMFSMGLTVAGIALFLLANLFVPYRLARAAYSELLHLEVIELYRLLALGISLWNQFAVPALFSVFWFVLYAVQLCSDVMSASASATYQGIMFFLLTSVSECCATPYSLLGLTFVVSYLALGLLNLCKFYLGGYAAVQNENVMHRSLWKHFRGLSMCLLLLVFPVFMAYKISQFFHMDFWLLILVSSCMLTSLQVTGTMLIYCLFMVELFRSDPIESLDEVIYWVNAISRVLEFLVALCVVAYGTWESLFGEWSWMGASVIIIHSYFNVWLRAQSGWKSFLLRREAAKKINSLPRATAEQLEQHNDVCSICFQEMSSAVITYCGHFFHGNCLRKWLYVQETCPMCHQTVRQTPPGQSQAPGDGPAAPPQRDAGPDLVAQEGEQNPENRTATETQRIEGNCDLSQQQKGSKSEDQQSDPNSEAIQDLRFRSSEESDVRFVLPGSSGGPSSSHNQLGRTSPKCRSQCEVNGTDSSLWSNRGGVSENQSASELTGLCPNHDRTSKSGCSLPSHEGNNSDENQKLFSGGATIAGTLTSLESCNQNSDSADSVNSHHGLCTYLDLDRLSKGQPVPQILQASSSSTTDSQTT
ncbi:hypothetical protein GOODEAATRI_018404, partial [Goodea atripinnis]